MAVKDVFKVYLYADPLVALNDRNYPYADGIDITSGILNVDIIEGTDIYEGPQEQIDTGQFTIVTRNPALDPKVNPNLKYNSTIKFYDERTGEFFRGYVTNIDVQYQREDNPIITITGTDIFGAMQRVVVSQATHDAIKALSTGPTWNGLTFTQFLPYMVDFTSKYLDLNSFQSSGSPTNYGFWFPASGAYGEESRGNMRYAPGKYIPEVGETYLDILNKYAQTNLNYFTSKGEWGFDYINVYSFPKYDPQFWGPQQDPYLQYTDYDFSSEPADDRPYETVLLDNGYNRVINQIDISNECKFISSGQLTSRSDNLTRTSSQSIEDYAISKVGISTIYPATETGIILTSWADRYSQNIFQMTQFPGQEIQQITFNNARYDDIQNDFSYSDYELNRIVRIKHKIDNTNTIDRIYNIAGIKHNISPDKWEMGFTLKPSKEDFVFQFQGAIPTIQMNAVTGDTNFNFTATLANYDPSQILGVTWALSATDSDEINAIWPYASSGKMFKNNTIRTGFTQTWNFDDDGILAPYSFDPNSTYTNPSDNRYGGYGPGNYTIYAYITLSNRFVLVLQKEITVGTPEVTADFGWSQNLTTDFGRVTFTDTSTNHETDEPDSYLWTFGDGTTSTSRNPIKNYVPTGSENSYSVSLRVFAYGPGGTKVYNTKTSTVTLTQPTMVPNFTFSVDRQTATFTNTSTNVGFEEPDAYLWDFGDGTTSTLKNPVKTYGVGENETVSFNVTLTTRNIWEQTASITQTVTIVALNASGTLPISQVRLRIDDYTATKGTTSVTKNMYPYMFDLKGRTSYTKTNLTYLAPTTVNTTNIAYFQEADGTTAEFTTDLLNLTRDSSITTADQYGLTPFMTIPSGTGSVIANFTLTTTISNPTQFIKDVLLTFRDVGTTNNISYPLSSSFSNRIFVDVPDSFGGWVNIGYFKLTPGRVDETKPAGQITESIRTMTALRPMPMNIPYFKYTISGNTVSFQSMETGTNYAWNFGDGTTSILKDPVKTYATSGTKTVTLTVTFAGGGTRTTTEPVIIEAVVPSIRYLKFEQTYACRLGQFSTPSVRNLSIFSNDVKVNPYTTPTWGYGYSTFIDIPQGRGEWYTGTTTKTKINTSLLTAQTQTQTQLFDGTAVTISGGNGSSMGCSGWASEWAAIADFKQPISDITSVKFDLLGNDSLPSGPIYKVYTSTYLGDDWQVAKNGTWTLLGSINPTALSTSIFKTYSITPS